MIKVSNPRDWVAIAVNMPLLFEAHGQRNVKLDLSANGAIDVWLNGIGNDDFRLLIGTFAGREEIKIDVNETIQLTFEPHEEDTVLFALGHAVSHAVPKRDLEAFTKIEPSRGKATEMEQMMMFVRANEMKRKKQADEELERLRKAREDLQSAVIEPPAPTPPTTAEPATGGGATPPVEPPEGGEDAPKPE